MRHLRFITILALLLVPSRSEAILFFDTDVATHNTTAPSGTLANSGWQYQGYFGSKLGTMISSKHFITAQHIGVSGTFVHDALFNGSATVSYSVDTSVNNGVGYWDIPNSDLRVFEITGQFPSWASLYTDNDEVGKGVVLHGRGAPRGADVVLAPDGLKGWLTNPEDGVVRWGSNTISGAIPTMTNFGEVLAADFDAVSGVEEAHLSGGDSGGGAFIEQNGVWKLAGVNAAVDGRWDTNSVIADGTEFDAALFDAGGYYVGSDAGAWNLVPDETADVPSSLYVSRVSAYATEIQAIIPEPGFSPIWGLGLLAMLRRRRIGG